MNFDTEPRGAGVSGYQGVSALEKRVPLMAKFQSRQFPLPTSLSPQISDGGFEQKEAKRTKRTAIPSTRKMMATNLRAMPFENSKAELQRKRGRDAFHRVPNSVWKQKVGRSGMRPYLPERLIDWPFHSFLIRF
jgi:hypothetical protein